MKNILISALILFAIPGIASAHPSAHRWADDVVVLSGDTVQTYSVLHVFAQTSGACGTALHCSVLTWPASASAAGCISPCLLEYNVFKGTAPGAESTTPINSAPISGLTYTDPVTLTNNSQTFYYTVEAVETSAGITATSLPSPEASVTFPGLPAAPPSLSAVGH